MVGAIGGGASSHVLYVVSNEEYSGAETSQGPVIASDDDALVACPPASPSEALMQDLGAHAVPLPFRTMRHSGGRLLMARSVIRGLRSALDLRRIVRQHREREVLYAIGIRAGLLATIAALGLGRRVVWSVTDRLPPGWLGKLVRAVASLGTSRFVCLSRFVAADVIGGSRRLREATSVVPPGLDPTRFRPTNRAQAPPTAAIVGHLSLVKRPDLALDVAAEVLTVEPEFRLRLVGSGQFTEANALFEQDLRARATADTRLKDAVEFVGQQPDVTRALSDCRLLLHCRADEPFGMVLIEAMAVGLPVVAPAAGGPLEIIDHEVTGFLYPAGDVAAAARYVLRLLAEPALGLEMGAAGRDEVRRRFTAARQVELTRAVLRGSGTSANALGLAPERVESVQNRRR